MLSAQDELKLFENIVAQSPLGLSDPELIGKHAKAKAQLHLMSSMESMNAQNGAPMGASQPLQATQSPAVDTSTPLGANPAQSDQNQPPMQNEGTELNLPQ